VLTVLLAYLVIYAFKLSRLEREVGELAELARRRRDAERTSEPERDSEEVAP
jgi:aminoglycoside N3'-acetyltransferase